MAMEKVIKESSDLFGLLPPPPWEGPPLPRNLGVNWGEKLAINERILPELLPGDLYATSPRGFLGKVTSAFLNAETVHWGLVVRPVLTQAGVDYEIVESLMTKGTSVGLFNKIYADIPVRIYRVKTATRPDASLVEGIAYSYGRAFYAYLTVPGIVLWWLAFHFGRLSSFQPPALDPDSILCTALVTMVWRDLGVDLVPEHDYPTPNMLEASENLECIYAEF
jgi:hypothetical protein